VTTSTLIPEGGKIVVALDNNWAITAQSVCTVTGLSAMANGTAVTKSAPIGTAINLSTFGEVASGSTISISCTYLTMTSGAGTPAMVSTYVSYDPEDNKINKWCASGNTVTVTSVVVTAGTSSDWAHTIAPSNLSQTGVNGSFKFKLSQTIPKGALVSIVYP